MNLRQDIRAALVAGLPDYAVIGTPTDLDGLARPTVAFYAADITPNGLPRQYAVTYTLEILTPMQDMARVDDALDAMLGAVLDVIWGIPNLTVARAERTTSFENSYHSWTLTLSRVLEITKD